MVNIHTLMKTNNIEAISYASVKNDTVETTESEFVLKKSFSTCSVSKLLTAIAVLQAKDEGLIDIDEDVNVYLKSWQLEGEIVTSKMLLINQSGIVDCDGSYETFKQNEGRPKLLALLNGETNYMNEKVKVLKKPGTEFDYADNNFLILELLLSDVYKKNFRDLIKEKILIPMEMNSSHYVDFKELNKTDHVYGTDKSGQHITSEKNIYPYDSVAGLWSTVSDLGRLLNELLKSYHGKSNLLLQYATTKEMMSPHGCVDFMGYGVFVYDIDGRKVFKSQGWGEGFQSYILGFLEEEIGIVVMMNQNPGVEQMHGPIGDVVNSFIEESF